MDIVEQTLKQWRQTRFGYGTADCLLSIGDYIASRGGVDVSARFRGTYKTADQAMALVAAHGGPQGLIDITGLPRIDPTDAIRGDVVVVDTGTGDDGHVGALCTGLGVAARLERGVIEVNRRLVMITHAWKVA
jgi:hypothetical protein